MCLIVTRCARRAAEAWEDKKAGQKERAALSAVATQVAALVTAHDAVLGDEGALAGAKRSLGDLLSSSSIEEADAKIDAMAAEGRLSPATVLALARAYNGVNESAYTKEEVKDVMAHLYFKARETYFRQAPPEIRILKYLLTIPSDRDRELLLDAAFQPGNVRVWCRHVVMMKGEGSYSCSRAAVMGVRTGKISQRLMRAGSQCP